MKDSKKYLALENRIVQYTLERNWQQFHTPKNMALSLSLEASELLELFQWSLDNEVMPDRKSQLTDELADVFYWLIKLSKHYDIDLVEALTDKMTRNEAKYPVEKARGSDARYDELNK